MNQIPMLLVRSIAPGLGIILGLLGIATLHANVLGWFLFLGGVGYAAGRVIRDYLQGEDTRELQPKTPRPRSEAGPQGSWLVPAGVLAVAIVSPLEFLYFDSALLQTDALEAAGAALAALGGGLLLWERTSAGRILPRAHPLESPAARSGPYRFIRYPAYAACLLAALGLAVGYASLSGAATLLLILLPCIVRRISLEDKLISPGIATKRLIPGIW